MAQTNCTSELTFLPHPLPPSSSLLFFPFLQTTKAFLPKMLELNHGHIVTVASSLGLFSTAGVEVSIIHNTHTHAHTSMVSHHPQAELFSQPLRVPARTLRQGRLGPLSLVVARTR